MATARFLDALVRMGPIWDEPTLRRYVDDELDLLKRLDPHLVVGDLRISLGISTRVVHKPYMTVVNAYWSPFARSRFLIPDVTLTRILKPPVANLIYRLIRPLAFAIHAAPLNRVCRRYGVSKIGYDLRQVFTYGDHTLYPDVPELIPTFNLPDNHHYLGPLLWQPQAALPDWWNHLPADRPMVYVTLGSSGLSHLLETTLQALADLPVTVLAATAGRVALRNVPQNTRIAEYLPGQQAAARAAMVICNGGSPSTYQALTEGVPVLGLASNSDQLLNMDAVQRAGAGQMLRASTASLASIQHAAHQILNNPSYRRAATSLAAAFTRQDAATNFRELVAKVIPRRS